MADLILYTGPMFSSKTTKLLMQADKRFYQKQKVIAFKSRMDDRYSQVGEIVTHNFNKIPAHLVDTGEEIIQKIAEQTAVDCVLIDEAQFLSRDQVAELGKVVDQDGIPVLAYGLRTDFLGETFEGSQYLLAWSDEIREIKAICDCGKKATMNARVNEQGEIEREGEQIEIGGNERYVSLCRRCFFEGKTLRF